MIRHRVDLTACAIVSALCLGVPCVAAEAGPGAPVFSVVGGVGNSLGWCGVLGERYLRDGRFSVFAGLGYAPMFEESQPPPDTSGTLAAAGGGRAFFGGRKHRVFVETSVSLVSHEWWVDESGSTQQADRYGPGLQIGYQLLTGRGVTLATSVGVGYAVDSRYGSTHLLYGLAVGYARHR